MIVAQNVSGIPKTPVLLLAGGEGTRLRPLTASRPKPLLPLGPFRLVDFTLLNCRISGLSQVALLTQYRHDDIAAHVRTAWAGAYRCLPPAKGKHYRGNADAVLQNLPFLLQDNPRNVLVLFGDHIYRMDYQKLLRHHVETNADVTLSAIGHPLNEAGILGVLSVERHGRVTAFEEKPVAPKPGSRLLSVALVSMGVYVFKVQTLMESLHTMSGRGAGFDFGHDVLPSLIGVKDVRAFDFRDEVPGVFSYWQNIGSIDSYYKTAMDFVRPGAPLWLKECGLPGAMSPLSLAGLSGRARGVQTLLSPGVRVEEDAEIEASVLMSGVRVGRGVSLRRVIVDEGVEIPPGFAAGFDPARDRERFAVSQDGVTVITRASLAGEPLTGPPIRRRSLAASW